MSCSSNCSRTAGAPPARRVAAWVALLALALAWPAQYSAAETSGADADSSDITASVSLPQPGQHDVLPAVMEPFKAGESLRFSVKYGGVSAGSAYLEVPELTEWKGNPVFTLVARAESNSFISHFYKVRNRIESVWDQRGRFSWRYSENRREGGNKYHNQITFDHDRHIATYHNGQAYPIPPRVQDALSSFYYTRYQALPIGGSVLFDYHASRKSQPLEVRVLGRERVSTPAGAFDCVVIEPVLKAGGIFKNKGRLVIWLTADERRMPVLMRSKVAIGSISVVLTEAKTGA
jgi:uncharacterized protein DUF3108